MLNLFRFIQNVSHNFTVDTETNTLSQIKSQAKAKKQKNKQKKVHYL